MQASIACVLGLVTCQSNMHIIMTRLFVAAGGVGRYQNRLEVDIFWHFSFNIVSKRQSIIVLYCLWPVF